MNNAMTVLAQDETLWTSTFLLILLGTYIGGSAIIAAGRQHRAPGLPKHGRKVPPSRGAHLDTAPIALPVTSIIDVPAPVRMLVPPSTTTATDWDTLVHPAWPSGPRPTYLTMTGRTERTRVSA